MCNHRQGVSTMGRVASCSLAASSSNQAHSCFQTLNCRFHWKEPLNCCWKKTRGDEGMLNLAEPPTSSTSQILGPNIVIALVKGCGNELQRLYEEYERDPLTHSLPSSRKSFETGRDFLLPLCCSSRDLPGASQGNQEIATSSFVLWLSQVVYPRP